MLIRSASSVILAAACSFCCLLPSTASVQAGSVEMIEPNALDIAREMGIHIAKFQAKFAEPVYATYGLTFFPLGAEAGQKFERTSARPQKTHVLTLTLKDYDTLTKSLGFPGKPEFQGTVEFSLFAHGDRPIEFATRQKNPIGPVKPGQVISFFAERQSLEELELDKPIPLYVKAGPYDAKTPPPKSLRDDYPSAPGYFALEVTFSKEPPKSAKAAAGAEKLEIKPATPVSPAPEEADKKATPQPK